MEKTDFVHEVYDFAEFYHYLFEIVGRGQASIKIFEFDFIDSLIVVKNTLDITDKFGHIELS
jgi:hypothetical protein